MDIKIKPLNDRILIKRLNILNKASEKSNIIIPDSAKEKSFEGIVVAVGPGRLLDNGKRHPVSLIEGDRVLFAKYSETAIKKDNINYLLIKEDDILCVIS